MIDDYFIGPALSCDPGSGGVDVLNEIGVFTHETGHAFGLPDLYDTEPADGTHAGAGTWDLMATGAWGCDDGSPQSPCHLGAWSRVQLGWANVVTLGPDLDHGIVTLPPVETTGTVYRIDANDGSGEYFLLENRQRFGYDQQLHAEGLLVWQIDPDSVAARMAANTVNGYDHMAVWLRQADGDNDLGTFRTPRGDAGDPFPGTSGNTAFHASSLPASTSLFGAPTAVTILGVTEVGDDVQARISSRYTTVTLTAAGASSAGGLFEVDGVPLDPPTSSFVSVPFVDYTVEAAVAENVVPGERRPFTSWTDAPSEPRVRTVTTGLDDVEHIAAYAGTQYAPRAHDVRRRGRGRARRLRDDACLRRSLVRREHRGRRRGPPDPGLLLPPLVRRPGGRAESRLGHHERAGRGDGRRGADLHRDGRGRRDHRHGHAGVAARD